MLKVCFAPLIQFILNPNTVFVELQVHVFVQVYSQPQKSHAVGMACSVESKKEINIPTTLITPRQYSDHKNYILINRIKLYGFQRCLRSVRQGSNYSRTSTNGHLSTTARNFRPNRAPIHTLYSN